MIFVQNPLLRGYTKIDTCPFAFAQRLMATWGYAASNEVMPILV